MCLEMTHTCARHAHKLEVRLFLTFQAVVVMHVLSGGLDECSVDLIRVGLAPALMSSPAAASIIVDVNYCTRFTLACRGTCHAAAFSY